MSKTIAFVLGLLFLASPSLADRPYPPHSIYNLDVSLAAQSGKQVALDMYRGQPVLVTMFYGSCPMTCPMLIDTLRRIETEVPPAQRAQLRILMISIDHEHDTPETLLTLAENRHLDLSRWTLAHADAATVRKIAAVLNVQYRPLPNGGFNHSNVITLLSPDGEIEHQSSMLGKVDEALLTRLK